MSARDKQYPVRLSDEERLQLEQASESAGFKNSSDYVRYMTIGDGSCIREDINKILRKLEENDKK